jgi:hypothetical protein
LNSGLTTSVSDLSKSAPVSYREINGHRITDPIAAKVLNRGESLTAPAGRADDFSWPRPGSDASATLKVSPEPVAVAPDTPEKLGTAATPDGENQADAKKGANDKPAINSHASARIGPHRYYNYHPGRLYGWYRGHHYSW